MSEFFISQFALSFSTYLKDDKTRSAAFRDEISGYMNERLGEKVKGEHLTQAVPTNFTIEDFVFALKRNQFRIRPSYQRKEVMTIAKASSLIESILLGIKLLPIYVFVRSDGIREVIDGQQRLLAIIGFLSESYTDEHGNNAQANKNNYRLNIERPVLYDINGKKYKELPLVLRSRILDFDLNIIDIGERENPDFKPEELYKRLNHKPFPIKEHSFEYWNAYVDTEITNAIKEITNRYEWLNVRKEDRRMHNPEMITTLCYLNMMLGTGTPSIGRIKEVLSFYNSNSYTVVRIKNRANITAVLESPELKSDFITSLIYFESDFVEKVSCLTNSTKGKTKDSFRMKQLDVIIQTTIVRMPMRFFILYLILRGIPYEQIEKSPLSVRSSISKVFAALKVAGGLEKFEQALLDIWARYSVPAVALEVAV